MTEQLTAYDPADHTVVEVQKYLTGADADEFQRVVELEREGKGRTGVLEFVPEPVAQAAAAEADEDGYVRVPVPDAYQPGEPLPESDDAEA